MKMSLVLHMMVGFGALTAGSLGYAQSLGEAVDAPNLTWSTGGGGPWLVETNLAHDGQSAATSTSISAGQQNWIQTTVDGPTSVDFWWKVSSGPSGSTLTFSIGGSGQTTITGEVDWQQHNFYVPPGPQALRWSYVQNSFYIYAQNQGWLDQVTLSDPTAPGIFIQPTNQTVSAGSDVFLSALASGTEPFAFQWQANGTNLPSETQAKLSLPDVQSGSAGPYDVTVTSQFGSVTSAVATLTVLSSLPAFTQQPLSQTTLVGSNAVFTAAAKGSEPIGWQWFLNGSSVAGATNSRLSLTNTQISDTGDYTAVATNQVGATTSLVATLTLVLAPTITNQPSSQGAPLGSTIAFTAAAFGSGSLNWQWYFEGSALPGATLANLSITNVQPLDFGDFWAVVTNSYGAATSAVVTLSFSPVLCWGLSTPYAQTTVPPTATNVSALAAGDEHCIALRADRTVVAWGATYLGLTNVPPDLTNAVGIAAGSAHSLAVRDDGTVVLWGSIIGGDKTVPPTATNIVAQALGAGARHALSLRADGTVLEWGNTNYGLPNIPLGATNVVSVAAGAFHSLALRADGTVVAWGDNTHNQTAVPPNASNIVAIAAGWYHNLALRADGTVVQWGFGLAPFPGSPPPGATNITLFACGGNNCLALRADGKLFAWGDNSNGQSVVPPWATNLVALAGGSYNSLALVGDGPPVITSPLLNRSILAGNTAYLRATAIGATPLGFQWQFNGMNLPGATNALLAVSNAQLAQTGSYSVTVSNALGITTSPACVLTVLPREALIVTDSLALTNGQLGFTADGPAGLIWKVQTSTNLADWTDLAALTNITGTMRFTDPATNVVRRFYRLRLVY